MKLTMLSKPFTESVPKKGKVTKGSRTKPETHPTYKPHFGPVGENSDDEQDT